MVTVPVKRKHPSGEPVGCNIHVNPIEDERPTSSMNPGAVTFIEGDDQVTMDIDDGGQAVAEFTSEDERESQTEDPSSESDPESEGPATEGLQHSQSEREYSNRKLTQSDDQSEAEPSRLLRSARKTVKSRQKAEH